MPTTLKDQVQRRYPSTRGIVGLLANANATSVEQWLFAAWMALLAFGVLSFGAVELWSLTVLEIGSALLLCGWLLAGMHRGSLRIRLLPIFVPAVLFFGLILFQLLMRTTAYRLETERSAHLFIAIGLLMFVGAQMLDSEYRVRTFGIAASVFGMSVALLAILQSLTSPNEIYWTVVPTFGDGVFGPYVNHSHFAGLMEMLLPFPFLLANARVLPAGWRGLGYSAGALMAGSIFVSGSRGGIVAASVQLCLMYFFIRERWPAGSDDRRKWLNWAAVFVVTAVVLWLGGQEMIARISSLKDPFGNRIGATRLLIFKDCLRIVAQRPVLGWGAGTFQTVYPAFRSFSTNVIINAAHNDYIQLLVEFGAAGGAITALFLAISYHRFGELSRNWRDSWPGTVSFGALLGTVGILVHSLTDFNLQIPANAAIFYVLCMVASLPITAHVLKPKDPALGFGESLVSGHRWKRTMR